MRSRKFHDAVEKLTKAIREVEAVVETMRAEHDPIDHLRQRLLQEGMASENELKETERKVRETVAEAAQFAQDCPEPDPSELWTDVLAEA